MIAAQESTEEKISPCNDTIHVRAVDEEKGNKRRKVTPSSLHAVEKPPKKPPHRKPEARTAEFSSTYTSDQSSSSISVTHQRGSITQQEETSKPIAQSNFLPIDDQDTNQNSIPSARGITTEMIRVYSTHSKQNMEVEEEKNEVGMNLQKPCTDKVVIPKGDQPGKMTAARQKQRAGVTNEKSATSTHRTQSFDHFDEDGRGYIVYINKFDVISGRGSGPYEQPGNINFREVVEKFKLEYVALSNRDVREKNMIAKQVIDVVRAMGGRFLQKVKADLKLGVFLYEFVDEPTAMEKTKQALRQKRVDHSHNEQGKTAPGAPIICQLFAGAPQASIPPPFFGIPFATPNANMRDLLSGQVSYVPNSQLQVFDMTSLPPERQFMHRKKTTSQQNQTHFVEALDALLNLNEIHASVNRRNRTP